MKNDMSLIKIICLNIFLTILLAEVVLRYIYTPESLKNRILLNELATTQANNQRAIFNYSQWRYTPFSKSMMNHYEFEIKTSHDQLGFRNPCFIFEDTKPYQLILGDSFVYGTGLPDEFTYGCLLQELGKNFYTLGIEGSGVPEYIEMLRANELRIRSEIGDPVGVYFILFLGNDFEVLINYANTVTYETYRGINIQEEFETNILKKINFLITKNPLLNKSYFIASAKLILKSIFYSSDKGNFIRGYAGSTYYKKNVRMPVPEISKSLNKMKNELASMRFSLDGLFLIEDPSALSSDRLVRDLSIAGFNKPEMIDIDFKIKSVLYACEFQNINCFDTREILDVSSYYINDNHLNTDGSKKLTFFINTIIDNYIN